jgi:RNA polymerase sigma-70 factor (ECF subfamily)
MCPTAASYPEDSRPGAILFYGNNPAVLVFDKSVQREALSWIDGLYGAALRLTRNPADAEDLVQDTYLKAFKASDSFKPGSNLRAWLFTILHNHFLNDRRRARTSPVHVDSETAEKAAAVIPASTTTTEDVLIQKVSDEQVQAALEAIPENFREAVWLRDAEGFSYVEIADMLKVPIGTVMSRISRGRRMLAGKLGGHTESGTMDASSRSGGKQA